MLHPRLGWITVRSYYDLQKAHGLESVAAELIRGGYLLSAAIYAFNPAVGPVPIPIGGTLLGAALLDLDQALKAESPDPTRLAKAIYKVVGPGGALIQAFESMQLITDPEALRRALLGVAEAVRDPCNPTTIDLIAEFFNPTLRTVREEECREKQAGR